MKLFHDLKTNKKGIAIWTLMILAIGAMIQNGAGATAMAFNGRHYDFFTVNFGEHESRNSGQQHFNHGLRFSGFDDDDDDRGGLSTQVKKGAHGNSFLPVGQFDGWDGDFDIVNSPRYSRRRGHDNDRGPKPNYRSWEFPRLDDEPGDGEDGDDEPGDDDCDYYTTGDGDSGTIPPVSTPEPATLMLLGGGLLGLAGLKKKKI